MNTIKIIKINENKVVLAFNNSKKTYILDKDFDEPIISFRLCSKILNDFNVEHKLSLLIKIINSKLLLGMGDMLFDDSNKELSIYETLKICVNFLNLIYFKVDNDYKNLSKELIDAYNLNYKHENN